MPNAASAADNTSDTVSRNPIASTRPSDSSRVRISFQMPLAFFSAGTSQMRSRSFCSSAKTVVAPISSVTTPTIVAIVLFAGSLALLTSPSIALAPSGPSSPRSWSKIAPCAASCPNTRPATPMTMIRSGATEKSV